MRTLLLVVDGELMKGDDVRALQQALTDKGFPCGKVDGVFGVGTEVAVRAFQASEGDLLADGEAGPRTLARLGLPRMLRCLPSWGQSMVLSPGY
jgi:peptidoglycan hydrolase-like protein with peptidoglycan-binding domain